MIVAAERVLGPAWHQKTGRRRVTSQMDAPGCGQDRLASSGTGDADTPGRPSPVPHLPRRSIPSRLPHPAVTGARHQGRKTGRDADNAPVQTATWYQRTFHGRADQVSQVRRGIASHLGSCPAVADAVLIASELAANAVTHSASQGEFFTVRCQAYPDYVWIECEDLGGEWQRKPGDDRPHGLDIVQTLVGPGNWGTETTHDGDRIVWARLALPQQRA